MVKYEWDESNGVSVPTNKLMAIDADEYYVGMPLKKVDAETVAPTDGDPEYICLAQRNAGDEIRPLQIPVQEVFPDAVYTKILEDGTEEKVKFGGGGKIKPEQLPEGYPYVDVKEITAEHNPDDSHETTLQGFTPFKVGDTVRVKIDGVDYSLVAYDGGWAPVIGDIPDDVEENTGEYGWCLYCYEGNVVFFSFMFVTVSWEGKEYIKFDANYLPHHNYYTNGVEVSATAEIEKNKLYGVNFQGTVSYPISLNTSLYEGKPCWVFVAAEGVDELSYGTVTGQFEQADCSLTLPRGFDGETYRISFEKNLLIAKWEEGEQVRDWVYVRYIDISPTELRVAYGGDMSGSQYLGLPHMIGVSFYDQKTALNRIEMWNEHGNILYALTIGEEGIVKTEAIGYV